MNLIIDQGNTIAKVALFQGDTLHSVANYDDLTPEVIEPWLASGEVERAIYSTVACEGEAVKRCLEARVPHFISFNSSTELPLTLGYRTPSTLGRDRIAAMVGAQIAQPQTTTLVIDAGSAITFDLLVEGTHFEGGNIAPGVEMRLKSLEYFTQRLPRIGSEGELPRMGVDTPTAIRAGVIYGIVYEIEGYISYLKEIYPDLFVFLTGGDAFLLVERLKSTIFADKNLVLKGLNRILNYNAQK